MLAFRLKYTPFQFSTLFFFMTFYLGLHFQGWENYFTKLFFLLFIYQKQYGEIEDCQIDDSSLHAVITFKTRAEAEAVSIVFLDNTLQHSDTLCYASVLDKM